MLTEPIIYELMFNCCDYVDRGMQLVLDCISVSIGMCDAGILKSMMMMMEGYAAQSLCHGLHFQGTPFGPQGDGNNGCTTGVLYFSMPLSRYLTCQDVKGLIKTSHISSSLCCPQADKPVTNYK